MPRYPYSCSDPGCYYIENVFKPISQYDEPVTCPECGAVMEHDFMALGTPSTLDRPFRKPIEMYSIAPTNSQEVADLRRKCPDVQFTRDGLVPLARNRAEKLRLLKAVKFQELS